MQLGFIGLAIMGTPMAGHLPAAGHSLLFHIRSKVPEALASGTPSLPVTGQFTPAQVPADGQRVI